MLSPEPGRARTPRNAPVAILGTDACLAGACGEDAGTRAGLKGACTS